MKKIVKNIMSVTLGVLLVGTTFTGCNLLKKEVKEKKVASVYGKAVTEKEYKTFFTLTVLNEELATQKPIWNQEQNGKKLTDLAQEYALNSAISEKVLEVKASKAKIKLTSKEQKELNKEYTKSKESLKQYSTKLDVILKKISFKKEDFYNQLKKFIVGDGVIKKYKQKVYKNYNPTITAKEISAAIAAAKKDGTYEKVKAKHILINVTSSSNTTTTPKHTDAEAKAKAEDILKKLKSGAKFEDLAKKYSEDTGSAASGGELGYFTKGQMVAEFENVAFSLKKGEISGLVKTKFGYHIIKVEDHTVLTEKQAKENIKTTKFNTYSTELLTKWQKEAKVKKYDTKIKIAGEKTKKTTTTNKK